MTIGVILFVTVGLQQLPSARPAPASAKPAETCGDGILPPWLYCEQRLVIWFAEVCSTDRAKRDEDRKTLVHLDLTSVSNAIDKRARTIDFGGSHSHRSKKRTHHLEASSTAKYSRPQTSALSVNKAVETLTQHTLSSRHPLDHLLHLPTLSSYSNSWRAMCSPDEGGFVGCLRLQIDIRQRSQFDRFDRGQDDTETGQERLSQAERNADVGGVEKELGDLRQARTACGRSSGAPHGMDIDHDTSTGSMLPNSSRRD